MLSIDTDILFAAVEVSNASHEAAAAFLEDADGERAYEDEEEDGPAVGEEDVD